MVQTPTKLDESQRKLLEELADARGEVGDGIAKTHADDKGFFEKLRKAFTG